MQGSHLLSAVSRQPTTVAHEPLNIGLDGRFRMAPKAKGSLKLAGPLVRNVVLKPAKEDYHAGC